MTNEELVQELAVEQTEEKVVRLLAPYIECGDCPCIGKCDACRSKSCWKVLLEYVRGSK